VLLERARLAHDRGDTARAATLIDRLIAITADGDPDYGLRREAQALRASLPDEG